MRTSTKAIFLGIALSISLSSCATTPTTPSVTSSNGPTTSNSTSPAPSTPATPTDARQNNNLKIMIQGDAALQGFAVKQNQLICLNELRTLDLELKLPSALDAEVQATLEAQGVNFTDAKTLTFSFSVANLEGLISGVSKTLSGLPPGVITATTHLKNGVGNSMGSLSYAIVIANGTKDVRVLLKPSEAPSEGATCSALLPEITGAELKTTAGGILATVTPSPSDTPSPNPTPTANAAVPVARIKMNVDSRFLNKEGETKQLTVTLFDAAGNSLPGDKVSLIWKSARPQDISVDSQGNIKAVVGLGYAPITVTVAGTDISDTIAFDVSDPSFFTSPSSTSTSTPTPQPTPDFNALEDHFRVDNSTSFVQFFPDVAMDNSGDFVVTWTSLDGHDNANFNINIHGQRYNAGGQELGSEFTVNTVSTVSHFSSASSVDMDSDGDFVVAWGGSEENKYEEGIIHIKRYDNSGNQQGEEILIEGVSSQQLGQPSVAMDSDGDFVVSWTQFDDGQTGIYFQRYTRDGNTQGEITAVTDPQSSSQISNPAIAMNDSGRFAISWLSIGDSNNIYAQSFSANGLAIGSTTQANNQALLNATETNPYQKPQQPSIAMDNSGRFVVSWSSTGTESATVFAQRFTNQNQALGSNFTVSDNEEPFNSFADVAMDSDGDFVVSWDGRPNNDNKYASNSNVYAKQYDKTGQLKSKTLKISEQQPHSDLTSVALDDDGDLVFAWQSLVDEDPSGEKYNIYARQYKLTSGK